MEETPSTTDYSIDAKDVPTILDWLNTRGGVWVWSSADLRNPDAKWVTPARSADGGMVSKPSPMAADTPQFTFTSVDAGERIAVIVPELYTTLPIELRMDDMQIKLTGKSATEVAGQVRAAMDDGDWLKAWYAFEEDESGHPRAAVWRAKAGDTLSAFLEMHPEAGSLDPGPDLRLADTSDLPSAEEVGGD